MHGGERTESSNGAAHECKREEWEAVLRWRTTMERVGTGKDADERDRLLGVAA